MLVNYTYSCPPNQANETEKELTFLHLSPPNFGNGKVKKKKKKQEEEKEKQSSQAKRRL